MVFSNFIEWLIPLDLDLIKNDQPGIKIAGLLIPIWERIYDRGVVC
jgi:hypothetical protein